MKSHGLLFSAPMARAMIDGTKTQTRRIITDHNSRGNFKASQLDLTKAWVDPGPSPAGNPGEYLKAPLNPKAPGYPDDIIERLYPKWMPGDEVWGRETFATRNFGDEKPDDDRRRHYTMYRADGGGDPRDPLNYHDFGGRWVPSIHMPRWASRIVRTVLKVRAQRVEDITEADAYAEGFRGDPTAGRFKCITTGDPANDYTMPTARDAFLELFYNVNRRAPAKSNPWVWVLHFEPVEV